MIEFKFTKQTKENFFKFEIFIQNRILEKLKYLKNHPGILTIVKRIEYMEPATHRLRIGQYRLLLQLIHINKDNYTFLILKIAHRREVYR